MIRAKLSLATAVLGLCLTAAPARADGVRQWVDAQGIVHLSNGHGHGRSGRRPAGAQRGVAVPMPLLEAVIAESAGVYKIPPALVKAVIAAESNYNPWAVSARGAIGLMQLMPATARDMYVDDPYDPVQNIQGGVRYLRVLVNRFDGDLVKVLAAYNAGPELVDRSSRDGSPGVPPIPETQDYVRKVLRNYAQFKGVEQS
ncbi:MAG: lytic transglycosylase domain-containing protein [Deltaproteobacteria bacterium]